MQPHRITRRTALSFTVASGAGALAGCSEGTSTAPRGTAAQRTVDSAQGPVRVPRHPVRVACLDLSKINRMLDVGCRPVGVPDGWQPLTQYAAWYKTAARLGPQSMIRIEKVAAVRPDLILGTPIGVNDGLYRKLSAIAPTVLLAAPGAGSDWQRLSAADAHTAGRDAALTSLKDRYRHRIDQVARAHHAQLKRLTFGIVYGAPDGPTAFTARAGMGQLLTDLGARLSSACGGSGVARTMSYEQLGRFTDADVILTDAQVGGEPTGATAALLRQPLFAKLPASRAGHVYPLSHLFVFSYGEALALLDQIDHALTDVGS